MKFVLRNCREVTELVLAGQDRALGWVERGAVWLHMKVCAACPRFYRQVELMRKAMPRWRAYTESGD